jgi:preprotein translocase subunit SecG
MSKYHFTKLLFLFFFNDLLTLFIFGSENSFFAREWLGEENDKNRGFLKCSLFYVLLIIYPFSLRISMKRNFLQVFKYCYIFVLLFLVLILSLQHSQGDERLAFHQHHEEARFLYKVIHRFYDKVTFIFTLTLFVVTTPVPLKHKVWFLIF